jgi:ketosteroid isomerase-like protein
MANDRARVERIASIYDGWRAADFETALEPLDPNVEWTAIESAPDAGTYSGHAGVRAYMEDWLADFEIHGAEILESIERDDAVLLVTRVRATGRGSGVETELVYAQVYSFSASGKIERVHEYATREEATAALEA